MNSSQASDSTLQDDSVVHPPSASSLDLSHLPSIFVLPTHLSESELHEAEDALIRSGALLTYDIKEANIVLGNISKERRARFELRAGKVRTGELDSVKENIPPGPLETPNVFAPPTKRRRLNGLKNSPSRKLVTSLAEAVSTHTDSEKDLSAEDEADLANKPMSQLSIATSTTIASNNSGAAQDSIPFQLNREDLEKKIKVVKLDWLYQCLAQKISQPFEPYTIYEARLLPPEDNVISQEVFQSTTMIIDEKPELKKEDLKGILERAKADTKTIIKSTFSGTRKRDRTKKATGQEFAGRSFAPSTGDKHANRPTQLLRETTSEHDEGSVGSVPVMPDWVSENRIYSCERATLPHPPNEAFVEQLKNIKLARLLTGDDIGVRAYSTAIASLAAYPYPISSIREVLSLPGCDQKIAHLFHEWQLSNGRLQAVVDIEVDPTLQVLRLFYEIWGVGATTAREYFYDRGWRDLDDVVEHGWRSLNRVQQIGVKYYDEFQLKISRAEVESIAAEIKTHAVLLTDSFVEAIIVGSHRRGNAESGDVDVILTHRSERATLNLISAVIDSLEASGSITHVLTLALTSSKRDQQPLPLRSLTSPAGHGFDTLDKALLVWQDPNWPSREADIAADPNAKNPNPHRRVDIIVSPWRTIGCAVIGWTSGTTFNRDMRRYAKRVKGWKFDSSGVRERGSGRWMDLEGWTDERTRCTDWMVAERRVFEGMGLVYREPWERCTG